MGKIYSEDFRNFVISKLKQGLSPADYYDEAVNRGYALDLTSFRSYVHKLKRNRNIPSNTNINSSKSSQEIPDYQDDLPLFLKIMKKNKISKINELCNELNCPPKRIYELVEYFRTEGYELSIDEDSKLVSFNTDIKKEYSSEPFSDKEIIFGVASDLHFGSKAVQITALNEFCEYCKKRGVKHIFTPGDVVAGTNVFPGQQFEVYGLSAEEQEESVIANLPYGFEWYMMGGNHDYSFIKRGGGHNPVLALSNKREDINYVGFDDVDIPILKGVDLKMWHPSGGVPYAVSYRLQKGVEQIAYSELNKIVRGSKEKPSIRFVLCGHLHIQMQALFGSIFGAQVGTFEGQTNYLKQKGLVPNIGGYIIEAKLGKDGLLKNFDAKFYVFTEIEDDWKSYKHTITKQKIINPIMEYTGSEWA